MSVDNSENNLIKTGATLLGETVSDATKAFNEGFGNEKPASPIEQIATQVPAVEKAQGIFDLVKNLFNIDLKAMLQPFLDTLGIDLGGVFNMASGAADQAPAPVVANEIDTPAGPA